MRKHPHVMTFTEAITHFVLVFVGTWGVLILLALLNELTK